MGHIIRMQEVMAINVSEYRYIRKTLPSFEISNRGYQTPRYEISSGLCTWLFRLRMSGNTEEKYQRDQYQGTNLVGKRSQFLFLDTH